MPQPGDLAHRRHVESIECGTARRLLQGQIVAYSLAWVFVLWCEVERWDTIPPKPGGVVSWLIGMNQHTTPFIPLLLVAPLAWYRGSRLGGDARDDTQRQPSPTPATSSDNSLPTSGTLKAAVWLSVVVAVLSIGQSLFVAQFYADMPPAVHDEYSYLFQAETFLAGRLWFPSHEEPRLFDQMHVVNEGHFASRYFPGAGLWMAPFVAMGHPYWGHWLAGAITSVLVFWIGRDLHSNRLGFIAGSLTALAPGMGMFSNLLLAHHPTLIGLFVFLLAFLKMIRTGSGIAATTAGVGLAYAMLCRPATAAGFALPCGIYVAWWLLSKYRGDGAGSIRRCATVVCGLGLPLVIGFAAMFLFNRSITGNGFYSPYQQFTDIYTPRHVYGFNNVVRGERKLTPRVLDNYDRWAENLTPKLAARNVWKRHVASWQWTLGIIPLLMAAVVVVISPPRCRGPWWLIPAGIVSLHIFHVPYWFVGMLEYHYVFESGPLWTLVFGLATCRLLEAWRAADHPEMSIWWGAVVAMSFAMSFLSFEPFWDGWLYRGLSQMVFARGQHAEFQQYMSQAVTSRPAIVLIDADPADRHIDYVTNHPSLQSDLLLARYIPNQVPIARVRELFPDRTVYVFRYRMRGFEKDVTLNIVSQPQSPSSPLKKP